MERSKANANSVETMNMISRIERGSKQQLMGKNPTKFYASDVLKYTSNCIVDTSDCERIFYSLKGLKADYSNREFNSDIYNIYIGVNIWCYLFSDITHERADVLRIRIMLYGLQYCIQEAEEHRMYLISDGTRGICSEFWENYFNLSLTCDRCVRSEASARYARQELRNALCVLGCLKRIRISSLDYSFMYEDYLKANEKCKIWNQRNYIDFGNLNDYTLSSGQKIIPRRNYTREEFDAEHPNLGDAVLDVMKREFALIFKDYKQDTSLFTLPPGTTFEGKRTYLEKFKEVLKDQQWLREHGVNIPYWPVDQRQTVADCNRYISVPKNYKTGRGVAPEPISRQVFGYQVSSGMRKCLRKYGVDLDDQSWNQELCSLSTMLGLVTVDLSNASDSISAGLVRELTIENDYLQEWNPKFITDLWDCRTNFIRVNGQTVENHRFCTMGNTITCDLQSAIYLAAIMTTYTLGQVNSATFIDEPLYLYGITDDDSYPLAAFWSSYEDYLENGNSSVKGMVNEFHQNRFITTDLGFYVDDCDWIEYISSAYESYEYNSLKTILPKHTGNPYTNCVAVYNDDIIIPNFMFETFCQLMQKLGFTINMDKTFDGNLRYRESCGVEYYTFKGWKTPMEVTPYYYPRGTSYYALPELVGLQHKYYAYQSTNGFLIACILDVFPDMTCSEPGSSYTDIWDRHAQPDIWDITECYELYHTYQVRVPVVKVLAQRPGATYHLKDKEIPKMPALVGGDKGLFVTNKWSTAEKVQSCTTFTDVRKLSYTWIPIKGQEVQAEEHVVFVAEKCGSPKLTDADVQLVELLAYMLKIGNGIERINQSEYTRIENRVDNKDDLYCTREVFVKKKLFTI